MANGFLDGLKNAARRALCSIHSTGYDAYRLYRNLTDGNELGSGPWADAVKLSYCDDPTPVPALPPPSPGGQCPGVLYRVGLSYSVGNGESSANLDVYGPIRGTFAGVINGSEITKLLHSDAAGNPAEFVLSVAPDDGGAPFATITSTMRLSPGSDTCDEPSPPAIPPPEPGWNIRQPDVTYDGPDGVPVTVPVTLAFGYADIDVNAEISIPIEVDVGGINFNLEFNLTTGDINLFPRNNYFGDRRPGIHPSDHAPTPDSPVPDSPPGLPPSPPPIDSEGEAEERLLVGVLVTVTSEDSRKVGTLFQTDNPDISIPNLGYVSFLCRLGKVLSGWTTDIPVKNRRHFIPCPWDAGAFKVAGTPRPGVEWQLTPIYSTKQRVPSFP